MILNKGLKFKDSKLLEGYLALYQASKTRKKRNLLQIKVRNQNTGQNLHLFSKLFRQLTAYVEFSFLIHRPGG